MCEIFPAHLKSNIFLCDLYTFFSLSPNNHKISNPLVRAIGIALRTMEYTMLNEQIKIRLAIPPF